MSLGREPGPGALREEIAGYHRLLEVLALEHDALRRGDGDALAAIAGDKEREVVLLGHFAGLRRRREGAPLPASGDWALLRSLVARAARLNTENGALIHARRGYVDRALVTLHAAAGNAGVYGADGRSQSVAASRRLAAA